MKKIILLTTCVVIFTLLVSSTLSDKAIEPVLAKSQPESTEVSDTQDPSVKGVSVTPYYRTEVNVENFRIIIPGISVNKRVIANVDAGDKQIYLPVIENFVAHGRYTKLPFEATKDGNVYLFAHRDGHHGFFHRLDELVKGDKIELKFNRKTYTYKVESKKIVDPSDVSVYTSQSDYAALTLQTCENGSAKRLIIKSRLVKVS